MPATDPGAPIGRHFCLARMVKLVDAADLKSAGAIREGSIPSPGTTFRGRDTKQDLPR